MNEDQMLTRVVVEQILDGLDPHDRDMVVLIFRLERPDDWNGRWPPRYEDIGRYIGNKHEGAPLSEAAIRYRRDVLLRKWAKKYRNLRKIP